MTRTVLAIALAGAMVLPAGLAAQDTDEPAPRERRGAMGAELQARSFSEPITLSGVKPSRSTGAPERLIQ